ncbi:hypothetical protein HGRIS_001208 [Hohenbuehelia grisea]|uniref:Uncharacterized protein n=1 Tax=Hohenbuehelia grisea TaxID=104357 RepID=A0ABR3JPZ0_9AGAR
MQRGTPQLKLASPKSANAHQPKLAEREAKKQHEEQAEKDRLKEERAAKKADAAVKAARAEQRLAKTAAKQAETEAQEASIIQERKGGVKSIGRLEGVMLAEDEATHSKAASTANAVILPDNPLPKQVDSESDATQFQASPDIEVESSDLSGLESSAGESKAELRLKKRAKKAAKVPVREEIERARMEFMEVDEDKAATKTKKQHHVPRTKGRVRRQGSKPIPARRSPRACHSE